MMDLLNFKYHPVAFRKDLDLSKPQPLKLLNRNLVLWQHPDKRIVAAPDRCSHRGAQLSQGTIVDGNLECPYHGWQYDGHGACVRIPQMAPDKNAHQPFMCRIPTYSTLLHDGIVWISLNNATSTSILNDTALVKKMPLVNYQEEWITDYALSAPYNYFLQIENLLDPSHIHYVHDGFQGSRDKASFIQIKDIISNEHEISGYFSHPDSSVPDIHIRFYPPSIVDVSIITKDNELVRKNIIYVSPMDESTCKVLFRDVAFKKYMVPQNEFAMSHFDFLTKGISKNFIDNHYQLLNNRVVQAIMDQDVEVLMGQTANIGGTFNDYINSKYVLPTESDRLIVEFRKWCRRSNCV